MQMKIYSILLKDLVRVFWNEMGILNIDLNNINLDNNFGEDDPNTIILFRHLSWPIKFEKRRVIEKRAVKN